MLMPRLGRAVARAGPGLRRWLRLGLGLPERLLAPNAPDRGVLLLDALPEVLQLLPEAWGPRRPAPLQTLCSNRKGCVSVFL